MIPHPSREVLGHQLAAVLRATRTEPATLTPGQQAIAAAAFTEAAEDLTRRAESCQCADPSQPGLCAPCMALSREAVAYRLLAIQLSQAVWHDPRSAD